MDRFFRFIFISLLLFGIDYYVYQGIGVLIKNNSALWREAVKYTYWGLTAVTLLCLLVYTFNLFDIDRYSRTFRTFLLVGIFIQYFSKLFAVIILLVGDIWRLIQWGMAQLGAALPWESKGEPIPRSEFLAKAAVLSIGVPIITMGFGILSGAHDYRIRRRQVFLPHLPKAFDGMKIGQLSDIHSGSFFNRTAVKGGVELMMSERPDVIFFTGDLVNNESSEVTEYIEIFGKLKAPLGVYSITGNHDYGDYRAWTSEQAKARNFQALISVHGSMGWELLMNEHRYLEVNGDRIAVLGVENWGAGRFARYGKLDLAHAGSEADVKLLLSHDPSHWDAQVRPNYKDIDMMFAGHTHGFQFGVEIGAFRWSPAQYAYKQWAGLYKEGHQYLYVNRGFGYLGYPGRIGMPPELTVIELKRA